MSSQKELAKRLWTAAAGSSQAKEGPIGARQCAIVVFGSEDLRGCDIWLEKRKGRSATRGRLVHEITEWIIDGEALLAAVFINLEPGTYVVRHNEWGIEYSNAEVLVDAGEASVLDWSLQGH